MVPTVCHQTLFCTGAVKKFSNENWTKWLKKNCVMQFSRKKAVYTISIGWEWNKSNLVKVFFLYILDFFYYERSLIKTRRNSYWDLQNLFYGFSIFTINLSLLIQQNPVFNKIPSNLTCLNCFFLLDRYLFVFYQY